MTNETGSILIVEDDPINRTLLSTCLHEEGHTIRTAENGRQALDMLHSEHFDLMLLDLLMPEMDGFEVLKWIKARPELRNLSVIVVSAEEDMKSIVRCIEMGAADYLPKPYEPTLLKTRVKTSLAMKRFYELGPYKGKILVIDDNPLDRAVLSVNLTEEGYTVGTADNGRVGLQMLREQPFDIVLLDLLIPEIDGFDVLKIIKADLRTRHLPVIVISGEEDLAGITRCIAIGAEDYMQKPFDSVLLRARVSACVEKKRLRDQEIRQQQDLNELNKALEVQAHRARIEALEQSQKELELLNRAKSKALDHLSHELGTPLSVIQGNLRILKRKLQTQVSPAEGEHFFNTLEKNLGRLIKIQEETDKIIKSYQNLERKRIFLLSFAERVLEKAKQSTAHRQLNFYLEGDRDLSLSMAPEILEDILSGLIKNAIESTPDEGSIRIILVQKDERLLLKVQDSGIGITEDNQKQILHGLFHTLDTELYQSKKPYDFGAGGKGLDLFMVKVYGQRFGFGLSVESQRCIYIPKDRDICPGRISACSDCRGSGDCETSGGTTFSLSFQISEEEIDDKLIT
jgi:CheY-like chemotaxis protein